MKKGKDKFITNDGGKAIEGLIKLGENATGLGHGKKKSGGLLGGLFKKKGK